MKRGHNLKGKAIKLIIGEKYNLNSVTSIKLSESLINNLPKRKAPIHYDFIGEFYQSLKEELI